MIVGSNYQYESSYEQKQPKYQGVGVYPKLLFSVWTAHRVKIVGKFSECNVEDEEYGDYCENNTADQRGKPKQFSS